VQSEKNKYWISSRWLTENKWRKSKQV